MKQSKAETSTNALAKGVGDDGHAGADIAVRYAALLKVHDECREALQLEAERYKELKRSYNAMIEQREQDRQQLLRYAAGLVVARRSSIHTSRIIQLTGSPKILAAYVRALRTPGLGRLLGLLRGLLLRIIIKR